MTFNETEYKLKYRLNINGGLFYLFNGGYDGPLPCFRPRSFVNVVPHDSSFPRCCVSPDPETEIMDRLNLNGERMMGLNPDWFNPEENAYHMEAGDEVKVYWQLNRSGL